MSHFSQKVLTISIITIISILASLNVVMAEPDICDDTKIIKESLIEDFIYQNGTLREKRTVTYYNPDNDCLFKHESGFNLIDLAKESIEVFSSSPNDKIIRTEDAIKVQISSIIPGKGLHRIYFEANFDKNTKKSNGELELGILPSISEFDKSTIAFILEKPNINSKIEINKITPYPDNVINTNTFVWNLEKSKSQVELRYIYINYIYSFDWLSLTFFVLGTLFGAITGSIIIFFLNNVLEKIFKRNN